jgi:hypothetical protein
VECRNIKSIWIVRWHVSCDPYMYVVRFEEWMGTEDGKVVRLTKTEPKMYNWKCEVYKTEEGIEELATLLFVDKPTVVFATGRLPDRLKEALRRLPPSTYYLVVA